MPQLAALRVAILATDGVEQVELTRPREALAQARAHVELIAPHGGEIQGMHHMDKGDRLPVDRSLAEADPEHYDALLLPGGVANPDNLRLSAEAVRFVRAFFDEARPVAAICHGPWMVVEADVVRGRTLTSWPSLKTDIRNAGGRWVDQEVCVDGRLVTSRQPDDLPAFCSKMVELFASTARAGHPA